jgi:hypothetical protein
MEVFIVSTRAAGHLNPLLSVAWLIVESGHEVAVQVNEDLGLAVEAAGHRFLSKYLSLGSETSAERTAQLPSHRALHPSPTRRIHRDEREVQPRAFHPSRVKR